ncbi:MAG: carboxypeptidase-like regulatory domain-containing protein, partial [Acidobacteria bacterium]|nr:carboxypeptidase-like regulatory domain-containing protein [Acidobacteriota bacterium]
MNLRTKATALARSMFLLLAAAGIFSASLPAVSPAIEAASHKSALGTIRGVVRDTSGGPIADATVAIFRLGTSKVLKQVQSAADGSFIAKIIPGTYTVLAVAQGYNPVTLQEVEVGRAADLTYGFKLQRAGSGDTLPEKRLDRNNPKWVIRSAQTSRSIYQNSEGAAPVAENSEDQSSVEVTFENSEDKSKSSIGRSQTVAETYFGSSGDGNYAGLN